MAKYRSSEMRNMVRTEAVDGQVIKAMRRRQSVFCIGDSR